MKSIADALVYATTYINLCDDRDEEFLDDDVGALESIAAYLSDATAEEQDALAAAAKQALESERNGAKREAFISDLSTWMEDMFGVEWRGNDRA